MCLLPTALPHHPPSAPFAPQPVRCRKLLAGSAHRAQQRGSGIWHCHVCQLGMGGWECGYGVRCSSLSRCVGWWRPAGSLSILCTCTRPEDTDYTRARFADCATHHYSFNTGSDGQRVFLPARLIHAARACGSPVHSPNTYCTVPHDHLSLINVAAALAMDEMLFATSHLCKPKHLVVSQLLPSDVLHAHTHAREMISTRQSSVAPPRPAPHHTTPHHTTPHHTTPHHTTPPHRSARAQCTRLSRAAGPIVSPARKLQERTQGARPSALRRRTAHTHVPARGTQIHLLHHRTP